MNYVRQSNKSHALYKYYAITDVQTSLSETVIGFVLYSKVLIWLAIFQATFVVMPNSIVRITNASLWDGGVMVTMTVEMDQMRKIVVVRMFLIFPSFLMFI